MRKRGGFPVGKLDSNHLEALLSSIPITDKRVLIGPRVGEDAAVIDVGDKYLIAKTDPITFAFDRIGWYAVNINANDIAVMGGTPKWFLAAVLLPEGKADKRLVDRIFEDIVATCSGLGVTLCGGHTEITYGLDRPIVVGQMLGEVEKDKLVHKSNIKIGDRILLTKGVAIEGTAILAREKGAEIRRKLSARCLAKAKDFLFTPGISVLKDASVANRVASIGSMHDPTEGGLLAGLYEMAKAGGVGLFVDGDKIPILYETKVLCEQWGLNPLGLLASGALLIAVDPKDEPKVVNALRDENIPSSLIGEVVEERKGLKIKINGKVEPLRPPPVDEITKIFSRAAT